MHMPGPLLLVDDDPVFSRIMARGLTQRGFEVHCASSVAQALELLPRLRPDFALVDLRLPDGGGLELVEAICRGAPQAAVVVLTGYASIATAVDAIKVGATYYLAKPVDLDAVVAAFGHQPGTAPDTPDRVLSPRRVEWEHIQRVLGEHDGNISAAARAMGMHRRTLQRKLRKHSAGL